jgi:periplasmic divalent cation tolerance protein
MSESTEFILILSTVSSSDEANTIALNLVSDSLAACVNIVPGLVSVYKWLGKTEGSREHLLIIKTRLALQDKVIDRIKTLHSYDLPEIISIPILAGSEPYLDWIQSSTSLPTQGEGNNK